MIVYTPALDGLRGIAIILVLLHHYTILRPASELDRWIANVPLIGWSGVDLFFVLSGFLITGILIDARGSGRYFSSFYARRTLRIFPLYYLVVFLSLIVLPQFPACYDLLAGAGAPRDQWPYWLYLTNFTVASATRFSTACWTSRGRWPLKNSSILYGQRWCGFAPLAFWDGSARLSSRPHRSRVPGR